MEEFDDRDYLRGCNLFDELVRLLLFFVDGVFQRFDLFGVSDRLLRHLVAQRLYLRLFDEDEVLESLMLVVRRSKRLFRRIEVSLRSRKVNEADNSVAMVLPRSRGHARVRVWECVHAEMRACVKESHTETPSLTL